MNSNGIKTKESTLDVPLFVSTVVTLVAIIAWGYFDLEGLRVGVTTAKNFIIDKMSWFIVISINLCLGILVYLVCSKHGSKILGKEGDKPELSTFSWIALLFGAGTGAGFCFWPIVEPLWHYYTTPYMAQSGTPEALPVARSIALFHWGFHLWTTWALVGLAIAIPAFRRDQPMTIAIGLHGILGDKARTSFFGRFAEYCGTVSTIFAIAIGIGVGIMLVSAGINDIFGIQISRIHQIFFMLVIIATYICAAWSGLDKGMKFLGDSNAYICFFWFGFVLIAGPTAHLLDGMVETVGMYFDNMIFMATFTDTSGKTDGWPGSWSIFYYLWNTAWAPFVGGFIARISRGRTIREYIFGVMIIPVAVTCVWHGVMGTAAQYVDQNQIVDIMGSVAKDPALSVYALLDAFGGGVFFKSIVLLNIVTFLLTSADCASYFIAMQMNHGMLNPPKMQMLVWGLIIGILSIIIISIDGVSGIQTVGVLAGAPFIFIVWIMGFSLFRSLRQEDKLGALKGAIN